MEPFNTRYLADSMLGRLAKWLRVMGYDTHYQPFYKEHQVNKLLSTGRILLSRHASLINRYPSSILIISEKLKDQLWELREKGYIISDRSKWLKICLICNVPLKVISIEDAREKIPEYIFFQNIPGISFCPSCERCFWPGSHRNRMINQLNEWGF